MDLKENVLYKTTCDNKTYKLKRWANEGICCRGCINRGRRVWYSLPEGKRQGKFPSWKLVSKNKKQWEKKPIVIQYYESGWNRIKW